MCSDGGRMELYLIQKELEAKHGKRIPMRYSQSPKMSKEQRWANIGYVIASVVALGIVVFFGSVAFFYTLAAYLPGGTLYAVH